MLVGMGFAMVVCFVIVLMTRRLSALTALVLIPLVFGLLAGFGTSLGGMVVDAMRTVAPTGVMLIFAMLYFMVMTDAGMFDPLAKAIVRAVGGDPVKVFLGTVALGFLVALDGDGATVYMIVLSALLPLYRRMGLSIPMVATLLLHCTGLGNMLPWGGPTARAAVSMKAEMTDVFGPLIIPLLACVAWTFVLAWIFGRMERTRIGVIADRGRSVRRAGDDAPAALSAGLQLGAHGCAHRGARLRAGPRCRSSSWWRRRSRSSSTSRASRHRPSAWRSTRPPYWPSRV